jgi:hypothetical protein
VDCSNGADEQYCFGVLQTVVPANIRADDVLGGMVHCFDNLSVSVKSGLSVTPATLGCLAMHGVMLGATHGEGQAGRNIMRYRERLCVPTNVGLSYFLWAIVSWPRAIKFKRL